MMIRLVCCILAFISYRKNIALYNKTPEQFTTSSLQKLNTAVYWAALGAILIAIELIIYGRELWHNIASYPIN